MSTTPRIQKAFEKSRKKERMEKPAVRRTFSIDPKKCHKQILQPKHWNEDGTCKCEENDKKSREEQRAYRIKHVAGILGGAWSALGLLTADELDEVLHENETLSKLQQSQENIDRYMAITAFVSAAKQCRR